MSVKDLRYWDPVLNVEPIRGFREQTLVDFRDRVVSFRLEDEFNKPVDKAELVLNNNDGALMSIESLALGVTFNIGFGYVGAMAPPRLMQCRKMKGAFRVGGLGAASAPNTTAGGLVRLELMSQVWNMNMYRTVAVGSAANPDQRQLAFSNKTVSEIVRVLAARYGYAGPSQIIQDLDGELALPLYSIPADMSDAEWIAAKAKERGWVFAIDNDGFHFHQPEWEPSNITPVELTWFYGDPDVISWELDGDLNIPRNVQVRGVNNEVTVGAARGPNVAGASSNLRNAFVIRDTGSNGSRLSPDLLLSSSDPTRKQVQKSERILNQALNRWRLKMTLVGNPRLKARRNVNLKNFGPLVDGQWFVRKAIHRYAANQVYITELELSRRDPGDKGRGSFTVLASRSADGSLRNLSVIRTSTQ